jgi:ankyrin repeat protein
MNGRSLLHYAADAGNFDVLKELVNNGANVNVNTKVFFSLTIFCFF